MPRKCALILAISLSLLIAACRPRPAANVERRVEGGVETVINHVTDEGARALRPPRLEELLVIDTESADIVRLGLTDIWGFDVDSSGRIFVFKSPLGQGDLVYKFDPSGRFLSSFCRKGEGPGELQAPIFQKLTAKGELDIPDAGKKKMFVFDGDGKLLREIPIKPYLRQVSDLLVPLDDARFFYRRVEADTTRSAPRFTYIFSIVDASLSEIKELDRMTVENADAVAKIRIPPTFIRWALCRDRLLLLNDERGYEIRSYDFGGNLVRRMRREGPAVPYPASMKQEVLKAIEAPMFASIKGKIQFADPAPPSQHFWADDQGGLYVMTYEPGAGPGEFMIDIFDPSGAFSGRWSLNLRAGMRLFEQYMCLDSWTTLRNDRFYCLREKDNGYIQLVAYRVHPAKGSHS